MFSPVCADAASKKVEAEGTLEVLHEDYKNQPSRYRYFLKTTGKAPRELKFKRNPPQIQSGSRVKVSGEESSGGMLMLDSGAGSSLQTLALATSNTLGEQKVAVIMVNFQESATYQPITPTSAYDLVFNQVSSYQREASYGQTWLSGNVFGWYTLPLSYLSCDTEKIATAAQQAARNGGRQSLSSLDQWPIRTSGGFP